MFVPFIQGFGVGGGLIIAIGAQNAFVLSNGVRRNHPLTVALICAFCDALLLLLAVTGVGTVVAGNPLLGTIAAWGGILFLSFYGGRSFWSAYCGGRLEASEKTVTSFRSVVIATLMITLFNPHVYLDTLVLVGSISGQYPADERIVFGIGAMLASLLWFLTLSMGAGYLAPLFRKQNSWRVLDILVGCMMFFIAGSLLKQQLGV